MKNIILVGEYHSSNLGDNLLCYCTETLIRSSFKSLTVHWIDLTYGNSPSYYKNILFKLCYFIEKQVCKDLHNTLVYKYMTHNVSRCLHDIRKKRKIDLILFAGGQMFLDYFSCQISCIVQYANRYNIPVAFNSCGGGKLSYISQQKLIEALNKNVVKKITLRDSLAFIQTLTNKELLQIPDAGILCSDVYKIKRKKDSEIIGLGIISPNIYNANNSQKISENDFIDFWRKVICNLESHNLEWQLFVNGSEEDYLFALNILKSLNLQNRSNLLANRPISATQLISQIAEYKAIISFRLHSYIISYSLEIPAVMLNWDNKVLEFAKILDCEKYIFTVENFDFENFINLLLKPVGEVYSKDIQKRLSSLIQQNINSYKKILEL